MARSEIVIENRIEMINIQDYINFLKKKTLIVGCLNMVAASVSFCFLTACASLEFQDGNQLLRENTFQGDTSFWPLGSQIDRGVLLVAIAVIDAGQAMVSAILVIAAYQEWAVLVTPWLLHSALWLPAQGAAALAVAPPALSPVAVLLTVAFFVAGLLLWLRACRAVRNFQKLISTRFHNVPCSTHLGA